MFKLRRFLKHYKKELILGPFFKLLEAIFELAVPLVMAQIIDKGIGNNDSDYVWKMSGLIVVLGICGLGFALTCQFFAAKCAYGFGTELRDALYKHINKFSHAEIDRFGTSSLITRITNDTVLAQNGVNMFIRLAVRAPFLIVGAAVMSMTLDLKLSIIFLIAAPIITLIIVWVMKKTVPMYKKIQKGLDKISLLTRENLDGVRVIRAFSKQEEEKKELINESGRLSDNAVIAGKISAILNPVTFMIMNLGIVAILWFGGIRVDTGYLTQGEITAFVNYMTQILLALVVLANLVIIFTKAASSASRINEVFDTQPSMTDGSDTKFDFSSPAVEFENVSFSYPDAGDLSLNNISFTLKKGEILGIIGGTGSGKSTLVGLAARLYDTTEGTVLIDGRDVRDYTFEALYSKMGYVPQKAILFSDTIENNVAFGFCGHKIDRDDVEYAINIAQASDFVNKLEDGIDSNIAQGGANVSGGQKQRLAIARAVARMPEILIFDDSFSALDYKTDRALREKIKNDLKGTTCMIVAQRIGTIRHADKIVVLDNGEAVGIGTHEELMKKCPVYQEIALSQLSQSELE